MYNPRVELARLYKFKTIPHQARRPTHYPDSICDRTMKAYKFHFKEAGKAVNQYQSITVEDSNIQGMAKNHKNRTKGAGSPFVKRVMSRLRGS
jgi:type IV secretory pathway VirB4 component